MKLYKTIELYSEQRVILRERLLELLRKNDESKLLGILKIYLNIYENVYAFNANIDWEKVLQMNNYKGAFSQSLDTIIDINLDFTKAYECATKYSNTVGQEHLIKYTFDIVDLSFKYKNKNQLTAFLNNMPVYYYYYKKNLNTPDEIVSHMIIRKTNDYIFIKLARLSRSYKSFERKNEINDYLRIVYINYVKIIREVIEYKDFSNFKYFNKVYNNYFDIKHDDDLLTLKAKRIKLLLAVENINDEETDKITSDFDTLNFHFLLATLFIFSIQAWIWYLFIVDELSVNEHIEFKRTFTLIKEVSSKDIIESILEMISQDNDLLGLDHWNVETKFTDSMEWMIYSFSIYSLFVNKLDTSVFKSRVVDKSNRNHIYYITGKMIKNLEEIMNDYESKWNKIYNINDLHQRYEKLNAELQFIKNMAKKK